MLKKTELLTLVDALGLPQRGSKLVMDARLNAPVRAVESRGGNVITVMASRKMQREIRSESRSIEFFAALSYERDDDVLEYYPQPCELRLDLVDDVTGEPHKIRHFPDFLVIHRHGVSLVEWKSAAKMERLAEKYPWRYRRDTDGRWYAPLIERQLADLGIGYRIQTETDIVPLRMENLLTLEDYFHPGAEACPGDRLQRVRQGLQTEQALYLADLYAEPYSCKADQILKAIADRELVVDLDREKLTEPRRCRVYRDEAVRDLLAGYAQPSRGRVASFEFPIEQGTVFAFDGQRLQIALVGQQQMVLTDAEGKHLEVNYDWLEKQHKAGRLTIATTSTTAVKDQISKYTENELRIALHRANALAGSGGPSDRTLRRWRQKELAAQLNGSHDVLALVPRTRDRGNRDARLTAEQERVITQVIEREWLSHRAPNYKACHRILLAACDAAGLDAPSYPTLIDRIKSLDHTQSTRVRHGKRRAYQEGDFVAVLDYDTPVHGSRPFQYCHIDHTQLDIELVCSRTGKNLGRPWFSLAVDSFTRRILGIYLTYDPPSYVSNMMVLRDIVRRYRRLPQFIIADNGKDFHSVNFETFLQAMNVHLRYRPSGRPRHGAVLERLFGRAHSEYVHNLAGNTKATKNVRMTTGKYLPARLAEWDLEAMYYGLQHWAFEYYDQEVHPALGLSPRAAQDRGMAESGSRAHRQVILNQDFLIATCPAVDREGVRKIDRQRGVKFDDHFFHAPEFRDLKLAGTRVPVRYDPWDASTVYARVNHQWVRCINQTLSSLGTFTVAERIALFEEYRRRNGEKPDSTVSMQRLKEFLQTFTPEGALALHRQRQAENKALYGQLGQAAVMTPSASPVSQPAASRDQPSAGSSFPTDLRPSDLDDDFTEFDTF